MRKVLITMLCMSFLLTGCSQPKEEITLKLNEEYVIENDLVITLKNVSTEKQIVPHNTSQEEYDVQSSTEERGIFVDVQLKVKNVSEEEIDMNDEIEFHLDVESEKISQDYISFFLERAPYTRLNESLQLKAQEDGILHMTGLIKEKDIKNKMTCKVIYKDEIFIIDMEQYLNKNELKKGDTLSSKTHQYDITFEDIYMYKTIDPSNTEGEYYYSKPSIASNGFLIAEVVIKNNGEAALTNETIADIIFNVGGEYEGTYVQQETEKGNDFEESINIPSKSSKRVYYSLEKEPSVLAKEIVCQARIDGSTYFFNLEY